MLPLLIHKTREAFLGNGSKAHKNSSDHKEANNLYVLTLAPTTTSCDILLCHKSWKQEWQTKKALQLNTRSQRGYTKCFTILITAPRGRGETLTGTKHKATMLRKSCSPIARCTAPEDDEKFPQKGRRRTLQMIKLLGGGR